MRKKTHDLAPTQLSYYRALCYSTSACLIITCPLTIWLYLLFLLLLLPMTLVSSQGSSERNNLETVSSCNTSSTSYKKHFRTLNGRLRKQSRPNLSILFLHSRKSFPINSSPLNILHVLLIPPPPPPLPPIYRLWPYPSILISHPDWLPPIRQTRVQKVPEGSAGVGEYWRRGGSIGHWFREDPRWGVGRRVQSGRVAKAGLLPPSDSHHLRGYVD